MSSCLSRLQYSFYLNLLLSEYESKLLGTVARSCAGRWAVVTSRSYEMLQGRATSLQFNCLTNWQRSVEVCELFWFSVFNVSLKLLIDKTHFSRLDYRYAVRLQSLDNHKF